MRPLLACAALAIAALFAAALRPLALASAPSTSVAGAPAGQSVAAATATAGQVTEFPLAWTTGEASTHELAYNHAAPAGSTPVFWVTGQTHNALARVTSWPSDPCAPVLSERPNLAAALEALSAFAKD